MQIDASGDPNLQAQRQRVMQLPATAQNIFVIGIDGARGPAVREAKTPRLDALFAQGVVTYQAQTVLPSVSYPAWGSMLTGVLPEKHQVREEHPLTDESPWPSWISRLSRCWDEPPAGVFGAWAPIITDLIEPGLRVHRAYAPDCALVPMAAAYVRYVKPRLFFIHLDAQDLVGHRRGYDSQAYMKQMTITDSWVGLLLDAIEDLGLTENSLTIVLSDHGGTTYEDGSFTHGGSSPEEMNVLWVCRGPGIQSGQEIKAPVNITDTAAVILTAAGIPLPDDWDAVVPEGIFVPA